MKNKKVLIIVSTLMLILILSTGCTSSNTTEINIVATTDLHGEVPYNITEYIKVEKENNQNTVAVDAGDFFDSRVYGTPMRKYFDDRQNNTEQGIEQYIEMPLAKEMKDAGYDAVVLGNHEFVSNNKFYLDNMVSDFEKYNLDILSANTYKRDNTNYVKPYTIKEIETEYGKINLGILGLTIKEVGESIDESRELKDMPQYNEELYINDLVDEAKKWVKVMQEEENTDVIVAVAHSGEKPKKTKNPGNRIQELAQEVDGIDAIVAGHTHQIFEQHNYKNSKGEEVIVTQPGKHGEAISKITFELKNQNGDWKVVNKYVKLTKFDTIKFDEYVGELLSKISGLKSTDKEIHLSEVVPFQWDKVYVFDENIDVDKIQDDVFENIIENEIQQDVFQNINSDAFYWNDDIYEEIEQRTLRETLENLMGELSNREQEVLKARYGFEDGVEKTLEEVGQTFGVSRERIRQIEANAIRKLSYPTRVRKLKDFL